MSRALKITFAVAAVAIAALGWCSARAQQPSEDPAAALAQDWNAYQNAQKHLLTDIQAVVNELVKLRSDNAALVKERDELKAQIAKINPDASKGLIQSDGKPMPSPSPLDKKP